MQIGNVTNQYINTYNNTAQVQVANQQAETRAAEKLSEQQLMEYNQQKYREQQRWLAYIMMMQFFANENTKDIRFNCLNYGGYIMKSIKEMWDRSYGEGTKFDLDYGKLVIIGLLIYIAFFK